MFFARLTATGGADSTFGGGGYRQLPNQLDTPGATPAEFGGDLERDPVSGNLYLTAGDFVGNYYVVNATPTGAIDTTFSGDGVAPMPGTAFDMVLDTSGRPVTYSPNLAFTDDGRAWELTRLTTSGTLDATYGVGGVALVPVPDGIGSPSDVAMSGNIGYFPTCLCPDGGASTPAVVALDVAAADLVDGFSTDGVATVPAVSGDDAGASAADLTPDGKVRFGIVDFYGGTSGLASAELAQVTTAGVPDTAYSGDGHSLSTMTRHRYGELQDLVVAPDGSIVGAGTIDSFQQAVVVKTTTTGAPAPGFGTGGRVLLPEQATDDLAFVNAVQVLPDGRIAVLHQPLTEDPTDLEPSLITLLTSAGAPDSTFGGDGSVEVGFEDVDHAYWVTPNALTTSGSGGTLALHVAGQLATSNDADPDLFVQKVSLAGTIISGYGNDGTADGLAKANYTSSFESSQPLIAGAADGTVAFAGRTPANGGTSGRALAIGRLLASGALDTGFGSAGIRAFPGGSADFDIDAALHLARRADGGAILLADRHSGGTHDALALRTTGTGAADTTFSGDGLAIIGTASGLLVEDAVLQGDQPLFLQNALAGGTRLLRMTAAGAPDTTLGPGGVRATGYVPAYESAAPGTLAATSSAAVLGSTVVPVTPGQYPGVDIELVKVQTSAPPATAPGAPTGVSATAADTTATVTWSAPASNGGSAITAYTVTASPGGATCTDSMPPLSCTVTGLTNGQAYTFVVTATNAIGTSAPSSPSNSVTPAAPTPGAFQALPAPVRMADSRATVGDTDDEQQERFGALNAGTTRPIPIAGRLGIPTDAENAILSVVAVAPTGGGYLTIWPCGQPKPSTSSLNFTKGVTLANTVLTKLGTAAPTTARSASTPAPRPTSSSTPPAPSPSAALQALPAPRRMVDSRATVGDTDDEQQERFGALNAGTTRPIPVAGRLGIPTDADNAVLSVVAVAPTGGGYLTVWPCGTTQALHQQPQLHQGVTLANTVLTKLGDGGTDDGKVCVYTSTKTDLVIDIAGTLAPASLQALPAPQRIVDSRATSATPTTSNKSASVPSTPAPPDAIPVAGRVGIPTDAENVVLSVVAVAPTAGGYFTV